MCSAPHVQILSFNIWFSKYAMIERMQAIGDIIAQHRPDVVALQEMTNQHFTLCNKHPAFRNFHWNEAPPGARYYTMLGSRMPFKKKTSRLPFRNTGMGRDLLFATIQPPGLPPLVVATAHLESLGEVEKRQQQMKEIFVRLEQNGSIDLVFCGDTNIDEGTDGVVSLPSHWQDAWKMLRPDEPGLTWDVKHNHMMARVDDWSREVHAQLRYDRCWMRLVNYSAEHIQVVGDQQIRGSEGKESLWPSDHFGLLITLVPKDVPTQLPTVALAVNPAKLDVFIHAAKNFEWATVFETLSKHPEYVDMRPENRTFAAIHQAAYAGDVHVLQRIVQEFGGDPLLPTKDSETPEQVAREQGNVEAASYLSRFR